MQNITFSPSEVDILRIIVWNSIKSDEESLSDYGTEFNLSDIEKTNFWYKRARLFEKLQPAME